MGFLVGVDGKSHEVADVFIGVDGKARKVKQIFIGVDGKARVFYGGYYQPAENEVVLSLVGGEYFVEDKKFAPGSYRVKISGSPNLGVNNCFSVITTMDKPFQIAAFLSSGTNEGGSAASDYLESLGVDGVGTIFGGRGGGNSRVSVVGKVSPFKSGALSWGGACCHFMPIEGVFGTDYLRCFHCGAGGDRDWAGGGAYGGGAGGRGARSYSTASKTYTNHTGGAGIAGAGGAGGAGGTGTTNNVVGSGSAGKPGSNGSGIGAGQPYWGGVAYYDGSSWSEPTRGESSVNSGGAQHIIITYLGR